MLIQIQTTTSETHPKIAAVQAELATLEDVARDDEAESQKAAIVAAREPTEAAVINELVRSKRAVRSRELANAKRSELEALQSAQLEAECAAIAIDIDREINEIKSLFTDAGNAFVAAARQLDAAIERLAALHPKRVAAQQRNVPIVPSVSLAQIIEAMNGRLAEIRGPAHEMPLGHANVRFVDSGSTAHVAITVNRNASVPTPLR